MRLRRFVADRLILRPTQHALEAEGLTCCTLPYPGGMLECYVGHRTAASVHATDWEAIEPPQLLVLKLPGTGGRAERSTRFPASLLGEVTSEVWTWNPPGYGRSTGRGSLVSIAAAVLHFYDWVVARRRGAETVVWICGNSLGCATGLHLADQRPADALVLRNPPPLIDLVHLRSGLWRIIRGGHWVASGIPHEMDAVATASRVTAPIVFIESGADRVVPPPLQQHIRDAHPGPQRIVHLPEAEHDTPMTESDHKTIAEAVRWLWHAKSMSGGNGSAALPSPVNGFSTRTHQDAKTQGTRS